MTTATRPAKVISVPELVPYRLTVGQFDRIVRAGVLGENDRVELLNGMMADKTTKNPPHDFCVGRLGQSLKTRVGAGWVVREEKSLTLGRLSRPEPDVAVVRGPDDRYRKTHPVAADTALIIEVSEATYPTDRGLKWRGYAAAKVPAYWVVNLESRTVEVFTGPTGRGATARYATSTSFAAGGRVPVAVPGVDGADVAVDEILP